MWPAGIVRLLEEAFTDVEEVLDHRPVSHAVQLKKVTGLPFQTMQFPMYFTGAFESPLVVVHLNPKFSTRLNNPGFSSFADYYDHHRRFGHYHWEKDKTYRSQFDHKQVRFLRPFGVIPFVNESELGGDRINAALVCDRKLQLELVPYASPDFPAHKLPAEELDRHFERVLGVIAAFPRQYVLFCGAMFDDLLDRSGRRTSYEPHLFHLETKAGTSKGQYRFSNVVIRFGEGSITAGVARSFATQGLPMRAYGAKCHELYGTQRLAIG